MDRRRIAAAALALAIGGVTPALAQAPAPSPAPTPAAPVAVPTPHPESTQAEAVAPPPASSCDPGKGEICINAERQERVSRDLFRLTGFVDVQFGSARIHADRMDIHTTEKPDGTVSRRVVAEGNVVFMSGEERLAGTKLEMDLDNSTGVFEDAQGFVSSGVLVEADRIERVDADTYKIHGGRFTSCTQPNPRWSFTASSATLDVDKRIRASNVVLRVKKVPAFYIPYFIYPIEQDQRSTGFLFPHFAQSSTQGYMIGTGFFWAMNRSMDQTFYADHYTKGGWGFEHELRYALPQPSRGNFRTRLRHTQVPGSDPLAEDVPFGWEYEVDWSAMQALPGNVRATLNARVASNLQFQQQWQDSLDLATQRSRNWNLNLSRSFGPVNAQLSAEANDTFFGSSDTFARRRRLPSLRLTQSPRKLGRSGVVYQFETRAEQLSFGDQDLVNQYGRFDVLPRISRPMSTSFLQVTPQLVYRATRWGASVEEGAIVETPLTRNYLEGSLEMRGPTFSRVFENEGGFYSDRFKHTIGPEAVWTYRSKIDVFGEVPYFDNVDPIAGTHEVRYGLVQRIYAKRPGATGKQEAYEFLSWSVFQTYYVNIASANNIFDPNYSAASFGQDGLPSHYSPLHSRVVFRPTPRLVSRFDVEYDVNFKEMRSLSLSTGADYRRLGLNATWSKGQRRNPAGQVRGEHSTVRGDLRLELLPSRFTVQGSGDYDIFTKERVRSALRARYDVQCCGFVAEMIDTNFNQRNERQFRFSIELANIGSIGNFMGEEGAAQRGSYMGGR